MPDKSQQVRPQLQSFFLSPRQPAALAKKTPPRGSQPLRHAPSPNGEPSHELGAGRRQDGSAHSHRQLAKDEPQPGLMANGGRKWGPRPLSCSVPRDWQEGWGEAPRGGAKRRRGGAKAEGGWRPGPQSRCQRAAEVAVAGSELRLPRVEPPMEAEAADGPPGGAEAALSCFSFNQDCT